MLDLQVAARNNDVQLADFVESQFLAEQVKHNFCISFVGSGRVFTTFSLLFQLFLFAGRSHKKDLRIRCSAEKSGQRTWYGAKTLFHPVQFPVVINIIYSTSHGCDHHLI